MHQLSKQEIFDKVVEHLFTQGGPSRNKRGCVYRGPAGRKCAAGIFISDDNYHPIIENGNVSAERVFNVLDPEVTHNLNLLENLQQVHDGASYLTSKWTEVWSDIGVAKRLEKCAINDSLNPKLVYAYWPKPAE